MPSSARETPGQRPRIKFWHVTGSLHPYTTIWVVRVGDELYVRSYRGGGGSWFRHALQCHQGSIRAAGVERDVAFEQSDDADHDAINQAYRSKYARYPAYVEPMVSPNATAATLRLIPAGPRPSSSG